MFGVARDFRASHGDEAFGHLARAIFKQYDLDSSGWIDTSELYECLEKLGMKLSDEQLIAVLETYDKDGNGEIDESEWLQVVSDLLDGSFETTMGLTASASEVSEVGALREENRLLRTRITELETRVAKLEEITFEQLATKGLSPSRSNTSLPTRQEPSASKSQSQKSLGSGSQRPSTGKLGGDGREVKKTCPTCGHSWLDKYGKDECPKCLQPLSLGGFRARVPGEASTFKQNAMSAMESESGTCSKGGSHTWKFGRCTKCGKGEGAEAADRRTGGECAKGGKHVFRFAKCMKCGESELPPK